LVGAKDIFHTLVEELGDVIFTMDTGGLLSYVSPAIERLVGVEPNQLIGANLDKFIHPDDLPGVRKTFERSLKRDATKFEFRFLSETGAVRHVRMAVRRIKSNGRIAGLAGSITDITELKDVEQTAQQLELKYRNLVEWIPAAVYTDAVDEYSSTLFISPQIEKMTGYPPKDWVGEPRFWLDIIHPDDRPGVILENERTNATGDSFQMEYRVIARDGREVWIRDESALLRDADGKPICWQGVMLDITERKTA